MRKLGIAALAAVIMGGFFVHANAQTYPGIFACAVHQWMSSIGIGGSPACTQPAAADLSNGVTGSGAVVLQSGSVLTGVSDMQGALKLSNENVPAQITVDQNNYNPGSVVCSSTTTLVINSNAARNITGLAGGVQGCEMHLINNGSFSITLKDSNVSSSGANRFGFGGDYIIASKGAIHIKYDGTDTLWRNMSGIGAGAGAGTVTSAATTYPICGGPITTSGTLTYCGPTWAGRLTVTSVTALKFAPFNGDLIRISGVVFAIPSAGIAGCGNTGVFVNGVASQNLVASTSYNIYAFSNSGTVTCDFRGAGGHATSATAGNVGTEILSGDDSRALIGLAATDAAAHFIDGQTASWFNQRPKSTGSSSTTTTTGTPDNFVTWSNSAITISSSGTLNNTTTQAQSCQLLLDGSAVASGTGNTISGSLNNYPYGLNYMSMAQTEGEHTVSTGAVAATGTTTCTYNQFAAFSG